MTTLENRLAYNEDPMITLDSIFESPSQVTISWGKRVVSFGNYEGVVKIDLIASKFLKTVIPQMTNLSLSNRAEYYRMWEKIEDLYKKSDTLIARDPWYMCSTFFTEICVGLFGEENRPLLERPPIQVICGQEGLNVKDLLLEFSVEEFAVNFPQKNPKRVYVKFEENVEVRKYLATIEMIEEAFIQRKQN